VSTMLTVVVVTHCIDAIKRVMCEPLTSLVLVSYLISLAKGVDVRPHCAAKAAVLPSH
jgi:hypothetical protein